MLNACPFIIYSLYVAQSILGQIVYIIKNLNKYIFMKHRKSIKKGKIDENEIQNKT